MQYDVGVVGLGYVGLTLATALAGIGLKVLGVERRREIVQLTNAGKPHFREIGLDYMLQRVTRKGMLEAAEAFHPDASCGVYIITVGTPLGKDGRTRLDFIQKATAEVAANMRAGALVMLRSTVKIGTTREVVRPILRAKNVPFMLAICPERTLEGRAMEELSQLPQIVGADEDDAREAAARFFHKLTPTVVQLPKYEAAEIIKLVDNTFRDIQFGFANEIARVCEKFGVSAIRVIESGKLGYPRTNVAVPGLVGGPCLGKDPHILCESLAAHGIELEITKAARLVNERQPIETVQTALDIYRRRFGRAPRKAAFFGVGFKGVPETNDLRGTMALPVFQCFRELAPDARTAIFDPAAVEDEVRDMFGDVEFSDASTSALREAEILFITNNNPAFGRMRVEEIMEAMAPEAIIYDYWNHFSRLKRDERGSCYFAVGTIEHSFAG